jgi:hypothetical protein
MAVNGMKTLAVLLHRVVTYTYCSGRVSRGVGGTSERARKLLSYRQLHTLQWARANGCPWNLDKVLEYAVADGSIDMLEWLQQNSGRPWTAAELTGMLQEAGSYNRLGATKWLRERGAQWPSTFYFYDKDIKSMVYWTTKTVEWALSQDSTWGDWQCQQLAPQLYTRADCKKQAATLFAWAHKNGCPCTCNDQQ